MLMIRTITLFAAGLLLSIALSAPLHAADYSPLFMAGFGDRGSAYPARSPSRIDEGGVWDGFKAVESKNNQPRNVEIGTNPHNGTDIALVSGERVYPVYPGVIAAVNRDLGKQMGSVTVNHDTNGDGKPDGVYVSYVHISPAGTAADGIRKGDYVTATTVIGFVDIKRRFPPHLHMMAISKADVNSSSTRTLPMYKYYRYTTPQTWNGGADLDFLSADAYDGNKLYINVYSATDNPVANTYDRNNPAAVQLHYRIGSSGIWKQSTVKFTLYNSVSRRYVIDLQKATGAKKGQTIRYYIAAIRATDPTFPAAFGYRHALWPQYYKKPDRVLYSTTGASRAETIARTFVIR